MTVEAAGAVAAALSISCAFLAPFARGPSSLSLRVAHPELSDLDDANWRRPIWQWEALRAGCILAGAMLCFAAPIPPIGILLACALGPSVLVRSRAGAARGRARLALTRLLRSTEAALRSGASLPEALRRATDGTEDRLARRPFAEALRAFDLGAPLDQALRSSAQGAAVDARSRPAFEALALGIASRLPHDRARLLVAARAAAAASWLGPHQPGARGERTRLDGGGARAREDRPRACRRRGRRGHRSHRAGRFLRRRGGRLCGVYRPDAAGRARCRISASRSRRCRRRPRRVGRGARRERPSDRVGVRRDRGARRRRPADRSGDRRRRALVHAWRPALWGARARGGRRSVVDPRFARQ